MFPSIEEAVVLLAFVNAQLVRVRVVFVSFLLAFRSGIHSVRARDSIDMRFRFVASFSSFRFRIRFVSFSWFLNVVVVFVSFSI